MKPNKDIAKKNPVFKKLEDNPDYKKLVLPD